MPVPHSPIHAPQPGDSLSVDPLWAADNTGYVFRMGLSVIPSAKSDTVREASSEEVFGPASQRGLCQTEAAPPSHAGKNPYPFSGTAVYQGAALLLAIGYCFIIYRYRSSVMALAKILRSKIYTAKLLDDANYTFLLFINLTTCLGLLAAAMGILRFAEVADVVETAQGAPWMFGVALPGVVAVLAVIMAYRMTVVRLAGALTLSTEFTDRLWYLRKMATALGTIFVTPALLLLALNTGGTQIVIATLVFVLWALATGFIHYKTYALFIGQNFSNLHWFLYLCAVEIFPVSLMIALILRISWQ